MSDDDVEDALRTLRETLAVLPPAGFEAHVRARLAARRPAGRATRAWLLAVAAAALLAIALVGRGRVPHATAPVRLVRSTPPPAIAPAAPEPATPPADGRVGRAVSSRPRQTEQARSLVPPDGMARLARYVAAVRDRPLDLGALTRDRGAPLAEPDALAITAIEITPLEPQEGSQE